MYDLLHFSHQLSTLPIVNIQSDVSNPTSENAMQQDDRTKGKSSVLNLRRKDSQLILAKLSRHLLKCFGLWPYQSQHSRRRNFFIFFFSVTSLTAPLVHGLIEMTSFDSIMFIGTIFGILWMLSSLTLCSGLYVNGHLLKKFYEQMDVDYEMIKESDELTIMQMCSREATSLTVLFLVCGTVFGSSFLIANHVPLMYANEDAYSTLFSTYSRRWIIHESFHRLQVHAHIILTICYCSALYFCAMCAYLQMVKHISGLFRIVSHRLHGLVKPTGIVRSRPTDREIIPPLLDIVGMHRGAIESACTLRFIFGRVFYALQIVVLLNFAILISGLQWTANIKSTHLAFRLLCILVMCLLCVLYINYGGQQILDSSSKVFQATNSMNWDDLLPGARKILLMIVLRSYRPDALTGGTATFSMENVTKIMNMSWTLGAIVWSIQKNL